MRATQTKSKGGPASKHCACIISLDKNAIARSILLVSKNVRNMPGAEVQNAKPKDKLLKTNSYLIDGVGDFTSCIYDWSLQRSLTEWGKTGNGYLISIQEMEWLCTWKENQNQLRHAHKSKTTWINWRRYELNSILLFSLALDKTQLSCLHWCPRLLLDLSCLFTSY